MSDTCEHLIWWVSRREFYIHIQALYFVTLIFTIIRVAFVLFNDTWFQQGHSVLCVTILFLNLQITTSDVRPHIKWAVSLMIAYGNINLPQGFEWYVWVNILTLSPLRVSRLSRALRKSCNKWLTKINP